MARSASAKTNHRSRSGLSGGILSEIRGAPTVRPVDEHDADLPGCFVEQAQMECDEFWAEWRKVQRAATGRVPVLLMRRRRSRLLMVIAAEDVLCLFAAIRAVQEQSD